MRESNLFIYTNIFLTLLFFDLNPLISAPPCHPYQSKSSLQPKHSSLRPVIAKLKRLPESNRVIEEALREGSITVEVVYKGMPFEAMWESGMRKIAIDGRTHTDQGRLLCHLLFELTNAVSEPKYQELYWMARNGYIDCDTYVEAVEKIEHENMIHTVDMIEEGIGTGIFPPSARWEIIYDFSIHYKIQQLTGHSLCIAEEYQDMTRQRGFSTYRGTVKNLKKMSNREKTSLAELLYTDYFRSKRERLSA